MHDFLSLFFKFQYFLLLILSGKFRVGTEKTMFAMPETGIGLFPDVGGSFFLPRLEGELGMFLALTGHRLKGYDSYLSGITTHMCRAEELPKVKEELLNLKDKSEKNIALVLDSFTDNFPKSEFGLKDKMELINKCFAGDSVEAILANLDQHGGDWGQKQIANLRKMSPTSVKVTFRQIREGKRLRTLAECLTMEYRLVRRCCEDHDFYEGVRALLVDKDNSPKWSPASLEEVTETMVDRYFSRLPDSDELNFDVAKL